MRLDAGQIEVVDDAMAEVLRRKTPAERLEIVDSLWRFGRELIWNQLHRDHPDWDESRLGEETRRRLLHGA